MRRHHRAGVGLIASGLLLTLAACSGGASGSGVDPDAVSEEDRYGGTLTIGLSDAQGIDAAVVNQVWRHAARALSDSLVFFNPETNEIEPWLAESWEVEDDRIYTFTLREDVTFNDGTQLTADVVRINLEQLDRPGIHSSAKTIVEGISSIEVPSEFEIVVEFEEPNAAFLTSLSRAHAAIVSEETALLPVEERQNWIDGSGPFALEEYVPNQSIHLTKREDYDWAPAYFERNGSAYLDEVIYKIVPEDSVRVNTLASSVNAPAGEEELHFIYWIDPTYVDQLEAAGAVVTQDTLNPATGLEIPVNTSSPILQDVRVRQALQIGFDREEVVGIASAGVDEPATGPLSRTNPYYVDLGDRLQVDREAAEALLDEAGWDEIGDDGIRLKDGERLTLRAPQDTAAWQVLQEQWRQIGIDLVLDKPLPAQANEALLSGDYDLAYWYHSTPDADVLRANYGVETGSNRSFIAEDDQVGQRLDDLLQEQNRILDPERRQAVVDELAEILVDEAYVIPVSNDIDVWAYNPRVQGLTSVGLDQYLYNTWLLEQ